MFVRIIDENGFFVEDAFVSELTPFTIQTPCPGGFYKPRWNGTAWIEGMSQAEIDAIKNQPTPKTEIEILAEQNKELTQQLAMTNADFASFMDYYFTANPE